MEQIAIVTVDFNTEKITHECIKSLGKIEKSSTAIELIVVDNGSVTPFQIDKTKVPFPLHILRNEKNLGFTGGYNTGISYALEQQAAYILLLNNDTYVDKHVLSNMLSSLEENPAVGVVVPKIYFAKGHEYHKDRYKENELGKVIWYAGGYFDWDNVLSLHRGMDLVDQGQFDLTEPTQFASGCCLLVKREVFEKIGLLDNNYFLYFEDGDFSMRVMKAGYGILYNPKAIVWHLNAGSSGSGSQLHDYYMSRNRLLFGMRYAPLRTRVALLRESFRLLATGRPWQKKGIQDFFLRKFGKGSYVS